MSLIIRALVGAALQAACVVEAQTPPSDSASDIVVTGKRLTKDEAREVARGYTRAFLSLPNSSQYARWYAPVCPHVVGLAEQTAAIVTEKVRSEAAAAGVRVAKERCKPNLEIIFTDNAAAQAKAIVRKSARTLDRMSDADRTEIESGVRPVRWWYLAQAEGADGHQLGGETPMLMTAQIEGGMSSGINSRGAQSLAGYGATLIGSPVRSNFQGAYVLVDTSKADGRTLAGVAAYVSMVALAEIRMGPVASGNDTILTLFEKAEPAQDLSNYDRAFLKAVYSVPANRDRRDQAAAITAAMVRLLATE